mmetsp:Transcript_487/g.1329  ORF Transcript_487/g.1329 Transcript_487/m.1329 type:complete len:419 (+) Transcript_487:95-1351(+)
MADQGLLPTFGERRGDSAAVPSTPLNYGTELRSHHTDFEEGPPAAAGRPDFMPGAASGTPASQRVFRVTTIGDQDYDSIPHQRLKAVLGSEWWGRRVVTWLLIILCIFGVWAGSCYMNAKGKYHHAMEAAVELREIDTHSNDIVRWLQAEKNAPEVEKLYPTMGHPKEDSHTLVTNNPRNPLRIPRGRELALPEAQLASPSLLRLPVGLATTLYIQRLMQGKAWLASDITPGHDERFKRLSTLREMLPVDIYQKHNKRVHVDLLRLLRIARRAGVVTEVPLVKGSGAVSEKDHWKETDSGARTKLLAQLGRFVECTQKGAQVPCSPYKDVMRYPGTASLLYWGSFKLLRFDGQGVLFWRNGLKAYEGAWVQGDMHGFGTLFDKYGNEMWTGVFEKGQPVGSMSEMYHNYISGRQLKHR